MTIAMATLNVGKKTGSTRERPGADPRPLDEEAAWSAVLRRAPSWDGRFVYGVASTGIYCRPTCPSRRPLRRQVSFFADPRRAEAADFRACRRYRPHEPAAPWRAAVERARAFLETHPEEPLTLVALAREAGLSPHHLQRAFKRATGLSPKEYASALRTRRFKAHVRDGRSVTAAIYEAGYGSGSRVYESADARLGMTPGAYRKGGHGMQIRYALVDSPLGRLLVGATERGLCAVQLGDSGPGLEAALRQEYPRAELERDDAALAPWVAPILDQLRAPQPISTCRWTSWRRASSGGSGRRCRRSPTAPRAPMRTSRSRSETPRRCARSQAPAPGIAWPWSCPAIAWFAATATSAATGGAPVANGGCSSGRRRPQRPRPPWGRGVATARIAPGLEAPITERLRGVDWEGVEASLRGRPYALLGPLLAPRECAELVALYSREAPFRSRVEMERHRFGVGDYKYFAHPLPPLVRELRVTSFPWLATIANRWMQAIGAEDRYPESLEAFLARCHAAGQRRPTPLLLHYEAGGYNALHQDLYGPVAFPLQLAVFLSRPGRDYEGGAFLLVEQRPRAQSVGEALLPGEGEAIVFATRYRPLPGARGFYRGSVRHGVSRLHRGSRYTLGIIFHDAT